MYVCIYIYCMCCVLCSWGNVCMMLLVRVCVCGVCVDYALRIVVCVVRICLFVLLMCVSVLVCVLL